MFPSVSWLLMLFVALRRTSKTGMQFLRTIVRGCFTACFVHQFSRGCLRFRAFVWGSWSWGFPLFLLLLLRSGDHDTKTRKQHSESEKKNRHDCDRLPYGNLPRDAKQGDANKRERT